MLTSVSSGEWVLGLASLTIKLTALAGDITCILCDDLHSHRYRVRKLGMAGCIEPRTRKQDIIRTVTQDVKPGASTLPVRRCGPECRVESRWSEAARNCPGDSSCTPHMPQAGARPTCNMSPEIWFARVTSTYEIWCTCQTQSRRCVDDFDYRSMITSDMQARCEQDMAVHDTR